MADSENGAPADLEALIQAYLDGALSVDQAGEVERLLATSPRARAVFDALTRETDALRALFDAEAAAMAEARPIDMSRIGVDAASEADPIPPAPSAWSRRRAAQAALALAATLAAGVVLGTRIRPTPAPNAPGWRMSAAVYHRLYSAETFESAPVAPAALQSGLSALEDALGVDLSRLDAPEGLQLKRAQLLRFNGRSLAQLAFLDADGAPIALCFIRSARPASGDLQFQTSTLLDMTAVDWRAGAFDFLLIGDAPRAALQELARTFARQVT